MLGNKGKALDIQLRNISFTYPKQKAQVLSIEQFDVGRGEKLFLQGNSGSGKSTLLNILSGVLLAQSGLVKVLGQDLNALSATKRDRFRAQNIGVVFQQFNLIPYLSVVENILLAARFAGGLHTCSVDEAKALLERVDMPESLLEQKAMHLSVGQQQRVAIVRALINKPQLLIVDEPTSALDSKACGAFMQLLVELCDEVKSSLVFVSHDHSLSEYLDRSVHIDELNKV